MICIQCSKEKAIGADDLCFDCSKDNVRDEMLILKYRQAGHSYHCACRQIFGDGECECNLQKKGYDPYAWTKTNQSLEPTM
jgi:hypothetical protein